MIHTENSMAIGAAPGRIFDLAADVARWPLILPHYRYVEVLGEQSREGRVERRLVSMGATRSGFPVHWSAVQVLHPEQRRVVYHHTAGVTAGMDVEWLIEPRGEGSLVTILHDLSPVRLWLRIPAAGAIVGGVFVHHIADRTLRGIKEQAEREGRR